MAGNWGIVNRDEIHRFIFALDQFQQGSLKEEEFTAQRLQHGIYGQRQDDQYMVRIKIPGGILNREQLDCIGDLTNKYSNTEFANITTRQDIQLHFIELKNIPKVLLRLSDVGLTTREACGNTVRNITACSMAGVCPQEHVDVRPILNQTTIHFLRHPLTQHLPRKFKMSFSGCESDCAMGLIHDLAVVAVKKEGIVGFKVLVGGGLGHKPREAIILEEFVEEERIIPIIESVITLHNRYSDRKKRAKSRIKFLVERFGEENFREKYREILKTTENKLKKLDENHQGRKNHPLRWCNIDFKARRDDLAEPKSTVRLDIPLGDISPSHIRDISEALMKFELNNIRTTQQQNLLLVDVKEKNRKELVSQLKHLSTTQQKEQTDVVACPGSWTCRLGITASRDMAKLISKEVTGLNVNVSGCHNSCAQPQISDIGLHGEGRRKFGKLLPYYRLYLGGDGSASGGFALKGPEIPAVRTVLAIRKVEQTFRAEQSNGMVFRSWVKSKDSEYFSQLLAQFVNVTPEDIPSLSREEGDKADFRVLQLGGGECAGIAEETVSAYLSEIRYEKEFSETFMRQNEIESALDCAENILVLLAKSLLFTKGHKYIDDRSHVGDKLALVFGNEESEKNSYLNLWETLDVLKVANNKPIAEQFFRDLNAWYVVVLEMLDITEKPRPKTSKMGVLDLTEDALPLQYLKARQSFNALENGKSLQIIFRQGPDAGLVLKGLQSQGYQLLALEDKNESQQTMLHMLKPTNYVKKPARSTKEGQVA